ARPNCRAGRRASIRFHRCRTALADAGAVMLALALLDDGAMSSIALMMYQHGTTRCWRAWHSRTAGFWGSGCKISAPLAGSVLRCGCSEVKLGRVHNQHDGAPAAIFSYMDSSHYASHGRQTAETGCVRIYGLVGESSLRART